MELKFENKTALVTGSNRNTGEIIARSLAVEGDIATEAGCASVLAQLAEKDLSVARLVQR